MSYRPDANGEIVKISRDPVLASAFRAHLERVLNGSAMSSSPRSQKFLRHVIEKSIAGEFESLKERVIAIELFHRPPSFDKGEDPIVRVIASDVRKRLAKHYQSADADSDFRIELSPGSYIPEVTHFDTFSSADHGVADHGVADKPVIARRSISGRVVALFFLAIALSFLAGYQVHRFTASRAIAQSAFYPWTVMNKPDRSLQIVISDPDFYAEQDITGRAATLSDYASGKYFPNQNALSPDVSGFSQKYFSGASAAAVDVPIVADAAAMARSREQKIAIRPARLIRLADFHSDDNFLLLGGPVANPWFDLFKDHLDFRFAISTSSDVVGIENMRPTGKEAKLYSLDGGTEYAIIAFLQNPGQQGHVLILAGTGSVGTGVAGSFVVNGSAMRAALGHCDGVENPPQFEILLKTSVMAGTALKSEVVSCHRLSA